MGAIVPAIETRIKVAVLFAGSLRLNCLPEFSQVNFAPRIKIPVLMQNGKYDFGNPIESELKPLFELLGTPAEDKQLRIYKSGHSVWRRNKIIRDELEFFDKYLGPAQ